MKVTALMEHRCFCCGEAIKKGEECIVFTVSPEDPSKDEFDVIYLCMECAFEESCRRKIRGKEA